MRKVTLKPFYTKEVLESICMNKNQDTACMECGLFKNCKTPKMPHTGKGLKEVLIIAEAPGADEDEKGIQLIGKAGKYLRSILSEYDYDLDEDFWKTNAVICRPPGNKTPKRRNLVQCKPNYLKVIEEVKPKQIWLMGGSAIESFFMDKFTDEEGTVLTPTRWRGLCIPFHEMKAWVLPMFHPSYAARNDWDNLTRSQFRRDLQHAISCIGKPFPEKEDLYKMIVIMKDYNQVIKELTFLINNPPEFLAFDYETTGLKPFNEGHAIASISYCYEWNRAFAFLLDKPFFSEDQRKEIKILWGKVLQNASKKIAHNLKFEDVWSRVRIGVAPEGWNWCSMNAAHCLDNRSYFTGLKFQSFIRWGVEEYDRTIRPFLKSRKGSEFNRVMETPNDSLLLYGGMDSLLNYRLAKEQREELVGKQKKSFNELTMEGLIALSDIHINGICTDKDYYVETDKELEGKLKEIDNKIENSEDVKKFKEKTGRKLNLNSDKDLRELFFDILKLPIVKMTDSEEHPSVDAEVMGTIDSPLAKLFTAHSKLDKVKGTYIGQFLREIGDDGKIHPFFDLHGPQTFRGCIAKGSLIHAVRDFLIHPDGVPIEKIKKGDYVYCFDDNLKPTIRKVIWAGKTGHKKVIRLYWKARSGKGYLDVTPDHLIRHITGRYIPAKRFKEKDFVIKGKVKHDAFKRVLAVHRTQDTLYFSLNSHNGTGILEHRFIYRNLIGPLNDLEIVHHKNNIHLDHSIDNLEKTDDKRHASIHCTFNNPSTRLNNIEIVKRLHKEGKYHYNKGEECANYLGLNKWKCLRILAQSKGKISKDVPFDFSTIKKYCIKFNINAKIIRLRYDKNGKYISKNRLISLFLKGGIEECRKELGHNYYRLRNLFEFYKLNFERRWGNQFGAFVPNNHVIYKVEFLEAEVDVYDLEVEEYNNFFANEICVHNSSSLPNFQNIPVRDPEAKRYTRSGFFPSPGNILFDWDYKALEVRICACISEDPVLIDYVEKNFDMHLQEASNIFKLGESRVSDDLRHFGKNGFVFPEIYGSWYENCAKNIWKACNDLQLKTKDGQDIFDHMLSVGLINNREDLGSFILHLEVVEADFWDRFKFVKKWQNKVVADYIKKGYLELATGFRCYGYMGKKELCNYPIQGPAFHCMLYSLIRLNDFLFDKDLKAKIIAHIHDNLIFDTPAKEKRILYNESIKIATKEIREDWRWIIVPLALDFSETDVNSSWFNKRKAII